MKKICYFFPFLMLFSCSAENGKIYFRVQNNLGERISRVYLGKRILKGSSSYSSKSYKTKWTEVEDGELTKYKRIEKKFWGYSNTSLEFYGDNKKYPHQADHKAMDAAVEKMNITLIDDQVTHPYTKRIVPGKRLPDGKYTLTIEGFHPKFAQHILVSITKD